VSRSSRDDLAVTLSRNAVGDIVARAERGRYHALPPEAQVELAATIVACEREHELPGLNRLSGDDSVPIL